MRMQEVKEKAKSLGIKSGRIRKNELILLIQNTEGNEECFGRKKECDQVGCLFRSDCIKE